MHISLRCSRVVVFGGGSGIGKAIAKALLVEGAAVVIAGRGAEKLETARAEMGSAQVHTLCWDIARVEDFAAKMGEVENLIGPPDGFVNAAAVGTAAYTGRGYEPWDITAQEWNALNDVNFKGAFFLLRNEIDYLWTRGMQGNILNIASNAACMEIIGSYGAAKSALIRWTHAFGLRHGGEGIIINGIAPGATLTDMTCRYAKSPEQPYLRHAIGRFLLPEEIARVAIFLMSDVGVTLCGHTLVTDGGDKCTFM